MSIFDALHENKEASYRWLKEPEGKAFFVVLRAWREDKIKILKTSKDDVDLHRAQGALEIIERLINLPDELIKIVNQQGAT